MATPDSKRNALVEFQKRLFNSRFFTVSVLLHFIFVLAFGGTILFTQVAEPPDFTGGDGGQFVAGDLDSSERPPDDNMMQETPPAFEVQPTNAPTSAPTDLIMSSAISDVKFTVPQQVMPQANPGPPSQLVSAPPPPGAGKLSAAQARQIGEFTRGWAKGGTSGIGTDPRKRIFEFTAFLAKYGDPRDKTRGGDWASTNRIVDGRIVTGSLPNLLYYMNKMSNQRITAKPDAVPLDLSSDRIFVEKPPFIFFTGHRDFVLTEKEVDNLQKYVQLGGCIWGDSSLPGIRSRFDIAFRREMRRVIPDTDKDWEVIPPTYSLYAASRVMYYPEIKAPPPGVNFYAEPAYALKFAGEIAILYTANDYGDMWQFGLTEKNEFDLSRNEKGQYLAMNYTMWQWRNNYIRNISQQSVVDSYKFGTNVVIHLLTRWEEKIRAVPTGL